MVSGGYLRTFHYRVRLRCREGRVTYDGVRLTPGWEYETFTGTLPFQNYLAFWKEANRLQLWRLLSGRTTLGWATQDALDFLLKLSADSKAQWFGGIALTTLGVGADLLVNLTHIIQKLYTEQAPLFEEIEKRKIDGVEVHFIAVWPTQVEEPLLVRNAAAVLPRKESKRPQVFLFFDDPEVAKRYAQLRRKHRPIPPDLEAHVLGRMERPGHQTEAVMILDGRRRAITPKPLLLLLPVRPPWELLRNSGGSEND